MGQKQFKFFRDPIHGYVKVDKDYLPIIDSPFFQRLRRIKQLALTDLVYHGAEHSRFGHSLGAFNLASELSERLGIKGHVKTEFRLAALLHDIGHPPCSHAFESVLEDVYPNSKHEDYTEAIIRFTEIGDIIEKLGASKDTVAKLIEGKFIENPNFSYLNDLISSELDVDRMDFLLRDSYYCGVPYGAYDLHRLMLATKKKKGMIVIDEKGRHAAESFVLARFWMYTQVYTHHTRRAFDIMLKAIFSKEIVENLGYPHSTKKDIEKIQDFDDHWLFREIEEIANSNSDHKDERYIAQLFLKREPIRRVMEKIAFMERDSKRIDPEFTVIETLENFREDIAKKADLNPNFMFIDKPWKDLPFESKYRQYGQGAIKLLLRNGKIKDIADDPASLAYNVSKWVARVVRIYTVKDKRNKLRRIIEEKCPELKGLLV
ncbi:MAG: HD domain-containing protein [Candidatus Bathyarchaeia archaeon]